MPSFRITNLKDKKKSMTVSTNSIKKTFDTKKAFKKNLIIANKRA